MSDEPEPIDVDIAAAFGADAGVSTQCFSVYVPNKDKNGTILAINANGYWKRGSYYVK